MPWSPGLRLGAATACLLSALFASSPRAAQELPPLDVEAIERTAATLPRFHSLLVSWHGSLVLERYYNGARATRPANIKSASKSIISTLTGIAIDRGLIPGVHEPIATYFPDLLSGAGNAAKRQITIENLLTMQSGLASTSGRDYGTWVLSPNWVRHVLNRPLENAPGSVMDYSTGNSHLLSAILTKATKTSTWQFAQDSVGKPLGFTLPQWPRDPQGIYFGGNDMLLTPRQMLAFGELYKNRGVHNGRQVVPASWVDTSFMPRGRSGWSDELYGYGWWIRDMAGVRAMYAWGFGGQFIFVVPPLDLVVVSTSSTVVSDDRRRHRRTVDELVEQLIVAPIAARMQGRSGSQITR
jgi:CubicO group peptidase (beta-lactamase class C family)